MNAIQLCSLFFYKETNMNPNNIQKHHTAGCVKAFDKAIKRMQARNYNCFYVLVDIHETMMKPDHESGKHSTEWYEHAKDVMQYLTSRQDAVLILWTCSRDDHIEDYLKFFKSHGVEFKYYNENPECKDTKEKYGGSYDKKMFANVILDDKAGFDNETDWLALKEYFNLE